VLFSIRPPSPTGPPPIIYGYVVPMSFCLPRSLTSMNRSFALAQYDRYQQQAPASAAPQQQQYAATGYASTGPASYTAAQQVMTVLTIC